MSRVFQTVQGAHLFQTRQEALEEYSSKRVKFWEVPPGKTIADYILYEKNVLSSYYISIERCNNAVQKHFNAKESISNIAQKKCVMTQKNGVATRFKRRYNAFFRVIYAFFASIRLWKGVSTLTTHNERKNQNEINYYIISKRVATQHAILSRVREFAGSIYGLAHFFICCLFLVKG